MAPRPASRPMRSLVALGVILIGLLVWAFFPGTDHSIKLGLDLQGGTQVILIPKPVQEGAQITDEQLQQTVTILRQRVDSLGVAEAEVTTQGTGSGAAVVVSVPGASPDRAGGADHAGRGHDGHRQQHPHQRLVRQPQQTLRRALDRAAALPAPAGRRAGAVGLCR